MKSMMSKKHLERVRRLCSTLPETTERLSHGEPTFFVHNKVFVMFADNHHNDGHTAIWLPVPSGFQTTLMETAPETFFKPPFLRNGVVLAPIQHRTCADAGFLVCLKPVERTQWTMARAEFRIYIIDLEVPAISMRETIKKKGKHYAMQNSGRNRWVYPPVLSNCLGYCQPGRLHHCHSGSRPDQSRDWCRYHFNELPIVHCQSR